MGRTARYVTVLERFRRKDLLQSYARVSTRQTVGIHTPYTVTGTERKAEWKGNIARIASGEDRRIQFMQVNRCENVSLVLFCRCSDRIFTC